MLMSRIVCHHTSHRGKGQEYAQLKNLLMQAFMNGIKEKTVLKKSLFYGE